MPVPDYGQTIQPFTFPTIGNTAPSYDNIIKMLSQNTANESQYMPEIANILGQRNQFAAPQVAAMEAQGQRGAADLMGAYAKRGLTGGSIEAQGLATQSAGVHANIAEFLGRMGIENSQMFAQLLSRARAGDVAAQRAMMQMIAQAMGEEVTSQRDTQMFGRQQAFLGRQAAANRESQFWASLLGAGGGVGAAWAGG